MKMKQVFMQDQRVEINSEAATGGVLLKKVFQKNHKFYSKAPVLESPFDEFAGLQA